MSRSLYLAIWIALVGLIILVFLGILYVLLLGLLPVAFLFFFMRAITK